MKLQKFFFLALGLAFLVGLGSLVSGGSNQKAQVSGSSLLTITPANGSSVPSGTIAASCEYTASGAVPDQMILVGATMAPYNVVATHSSGNWGQNTSKVINGSFVVPPGYVGPFDVQCVTYIGGQTLNKSNSLTVTAGTPVSDSQAPSVPTGLTSTQTSSSISLSWNASNDNVGVTGYEIYRTNPNSTSFPAAPITTVSGTTYTNNGLISNSTYRYKLKAVDAAGNKSNFSATIAPKTTVVPAPTNVTVGSPTTNSLTVTWNAPSSGNIYDYAIYSNSGGSTAINTTTPVGVVLASDPRTFTRGGLNPNTSYRFRVQARDDAGNASSLAPSSTSGVSATTSNITVAAPTVPGGLSANGASTSSIALSWSASSGPGGQVRYNVFKSSSQNGNYTQISNSGNIAGLTYTNAGLTAGTSNHWYKVRACYVSLPTNCSAPSAAVQGTVLSAVTIPAAPTNLAGSLVSTSQINLSWNDNSNNETGFTLQRATNSGFSSNLVSTNIAANTTSQSITSGLSVGTTYYFRVRASNSAGNSGWSNAVSVAVQQAVPPVPTGLQVTGSTNNSISLSWTASPGATGYRVYRSTTEGGTYSVISGSSLITPTSYTNTGLSAGQTFYYRVTACVTNTSASNCSNQSSAVSGSTISVPTAPTGFSYNATSGTALTLSWTNTATNATSLTIQRATGASMPGATSTAWGNPITVSNPAATSQNVTGLTSGTNYHFRIRATNSAGNSAWTNLANVRTLAAPTAPTGVTVGSPTTTSLTVSWSAVTGATSYKVYRLNPAPSNTIDTSVAPITVNAPTVIKLVDDLSSNTLYRFLVTAVNSIGESSTTPSGTGPNANNASGTTSIPQIAISNVQLVRATGGTLIQNLSGGETINIGTQGNGVGRDISIRVITNPATVGSVVFQLTKPNGQTFTQTENALPYSLFGDNSETSFNPWQDLQVGAYTLRVTPWTASGGSSGSGQAGSYTQIQFLVTNNDDTTPPNNPTNVVVTYRSGNQIRLGWTNSNSSDISKYHVYRNDVRIQTINHPTNTFNDNTVNATATYTYKVTGVDASENEASVVSATSAPAPVLSTTFSSGSQVQTTASTAIKSAPDASGSLGNQPSGAIGTVNDGPVWVKGSGSTGVTHWNVDFNTSHDGWAPQNNLNTYTPPAPPTETLTVLPAHLSSVSAGSTINISCTYNPTGAAPAQMRMWGATITPYAEYHIPSVNNLKTISGQVTVPAGSTGEFHVRCVTHVPENGISNHLTITQGPPPPDTIPPVVTINSPSAAQVLPAGTTQTALSVNTNENATCRWSTSNQAYASMPSNQTLSGANSTSHSATLTGLTNGQSYTRYVRCQDSAGNATTSSQSVTFSVSNPLPPGGDQTTQVSTTCPSAASLPSTYSTIVSVPLCAAVQNTANPATITLRWTPVTGRTVNSITIHRKEGDSTTWTQVGTPTASSATWTDSNVTVGTYYEYRVTMGTSAGTAYGYISSGINVASEVSRGKVILVVDNTFQTSLATQIQNLVDDLNADRWVVAPVQYVNRTATPASVRTLIKNIYDADPTNTKAVYLLGHVPVASLGNVNPDGHAARSISADGYYGELTHTLSSVADGCSGNTWNPQQAAGIDTPANNARFCAGSFPSALELQVGRVDMYQVTAFGGTEASLLANYLNKVSQFKKKQFVPTDRAFVRDFFQQNGWAHAPSYIGAFSAMFGSNNLTMNNGESPIMSSLMNNESYVWAYGNYYGGSAQGSANNIVGGTQVVASSSWGGLFNVLWGSYFGEWNGPNAYLKSLLASGKAMASVYGSPRTWYFHSMGMGKNIGYGARLSVNNSTSLYPPVTGSGGVGSTGNSYMSLLGDPTLRAKYVAPPTNLSLTNSGGKVAMSWSASSDSGIGYNVYEIQANQIRKVNSSLVTGTSFTSNDNYATGKKYMVTRVKIEQTNSGTYVNESLGVIASTDGTTPPPPVDTIAPTTPGNLVLSNASSSSISFTWTASTDNVGVTGYKIFRSLTSGGTYSEIGTSTTNNYLDSGLNSSTVYWYKVSAYDAAGNNSAQTAAKDFSTTSSQQASAIMGLNGPVGPSTTDNITPGANPFGQADYFISCTGNDSNNGTSINTPWRNISKLDSVKFNLQPGARIMLKRGCPEYQGYFHVVSSGTLARPIEYLAYGTGSAPIVAGTSSVSNWSQHSGNIYRANIGTGLNPKYLFVNGEIQTYAQTPNKGNWFFTDARTTTSITASELSSIPSLAGKKIVIRSEPWAWTERVISGQSGSTITVPYTHILSGWEGSGWAFALKGSLDFLNAPGEWFYDSSTGFLYFQAPGNVNPNTLSVTISNRDYGFDFGTNIRFVRIKDLILEGFQQRGIRLEDNRGVLMENLEIRKSYTGIKGGTGFGAPVAEATKILNSHIHNIYGSDGIWFLGSNGNLIEGNIVEKIFLDPMIDRSATEWANGFGIRIIDNNSNFIVRSNIVRETGYIGIVLGGKAFNGTNSLVEKNLISKSDMMANDGGGIAFDYVDGITVQDNIVKETSYETSLMPTLYPGYKPIAFDYYIGNMSIKNLVLRRNVSINSPSAGIWRDSDLHNIGLQFIDNVLYNAGDYGIGLALTSVEQDFGFNCQPSGNSPCYVASFNDVWNGNRVYQSKASSPTVHQLQTWGNTNHTPTKYGSWSNNYFYNPFRADGRTLQELRHYNSSALTVGDPIELTATTNIRATSACTTSTVNGTQPAGAVGIIQEVSGDNCIRVTFPSGQSGWVYRWGGLKYANRTIAEWQPKFTTGGSGNTKQNYTLSSVNQMPQIYVNETNVSKTVNIGSGKCNHLGQPIPANYVLPSFASVIVPENCQ